MVPQFKLCSNCYHQVEEMPLDVREWTCPHCGTNHDRDGNAATNIRAEGIRLLQVDGTSISAVGGEVRPLMWTQVRLEAFPHEYGSSGCSVSATLSSSPSAATGLAQCGLSPA
jgi:putative transposase